MDADKAKEERLKQLQMADLGTARREYISAVDTRQNLPRARIEDLEAVRESNIPGTAAQKQAKEDKDLLNQWTNLHKFVGDIANTESQLNDLMHGQSHRANLNASLHVGSGQPYSFSKVPIAPKRSNPLPPFLSSGRGESVVGNRGRGAHSPPRSSAFNARAPSMPTFMSVRKGTTRGSNAGSVSSRETRGSRRSRRSSHSLNFSGKSPNVRPKKHRAEEDFSGSISTPEHFLAQARLTTAKLQSSPATSSQDEPETTIPAFNPHVPKTPATLQLAAASVVPETSTPLGRAPGQKSSIAVSPVNFSKTLSTSAKPEASVFEFQRSSALPKLPSKPPASSAPRKGDLKTNILPAKPPPVDIFTPKAEIEIKKGDTLRAQAKPQIPSRVLLDIEGPRETPAAVFPNNLFLSPGLSDLKGLDFTIDKTEEQTFSEEQSSDTKTEVPIPLVVPESAKEQMKKAAQGIMTAMERNSLMEAATHAQEFREHIAACQNILDGFLSKFFQQPTALSSSGLDADEEKPTKAAPITPSKPELGDSFKKYRSPPRTPSSGESKSKEKFFDAPELSQTPNKKSYKSSENLIELPMFPKPQKENQRPKPKVIGIQPYQPRK